MKIIQIDNVLFDVDEFLYAEASQSLMHTGTRIWLKTNSGGDSCKPYFDVQTPLWKVHDALNG